MSYEYQLPHLSMSRFIPVVALVLAFGAVAFAIGIITNPMTPAFGGF